MDKIFGNFRKESQKWRKPRLWRMSDGPNPGGPTIKKSLVRRPPPPHGQQGEWQEAGPEILHLKTFLPKLFFEKRPKIFHKASKNKFDLLSEGVQQRGEKHGHKPVKRMHCKKTPHMQNCTKNENSFRSLTEGGKKSKNKIAQRFLGAAVFFSENVISRIGAPWQVG